jgi:phosphoglycolate phosphatase
MFKAVIFDFDGTLADTRHLLYQVYDRLAGKHGYQKFSLAELEAMNSLSIRDRFKKTGVPLFKLPGLTREALAIYGEFISSAAPFPGIPELLRELKSRGLFLSIISSNSAGNINAFLAAHDLALFDRVRSSTGIFGKHRAINRLLGDLGIAKREAVYIGDELRDITACRKVPIPIIAVSWGYDHLSLLREGGPDFLVHHPGEIAPLAGG